MISGLNQTKAVAAAKIITTMNKKRFSLFKALISFHQDIGDHIKVNIYIFQVVSDRSKL